MMFKEKTCAKCGKTVIRCSFGKYVYRRDSKVYCGWNCYIRDENSEPVLNNPCVCCGKEIPEGRQVCPDCEKLSRRKK